jgi:methyl-accepting chemotaxis protein
MNWFLNLKTAPKLILAFVSVALKLGAVGVYALMNLSTMRDNLDELYSNNLVSVREMSAKLA